MAKTPAAPAKGTKTAKPLPTANAGDLKKTSPGGKKK
jgi:hypothetical protein